MADPKQTADPHDEIVQRLRATNFTPQLMQFAAWWDETLDSAIFRAWLSGQAEAALEDRPFELLKTLFHIRILVCAPDGMREFQDSRDRIEAARALYKQAINECEKALRAVVLAHGEIYGEVVQPEGEPKKNTPLWVGGPARKIRLAIKELELSLHELDQSKPSGLDPSKVGKRGGASDLDGALRGAAVRQVAEIIGNEYAQISKLLSLTGIKGINARYVRTRLKKGA